MAKRKVVVLPDRDGGRGNPIPACVVLGNLILPSVIQGNPRISKDPEKQVHEAFKKMKDVVEAAGGTTDNIGKVIVYLKDFQHRELVNKEWLKMFPNENDRPARHVMKADLQGDVLIQLDVIAAL
jgi:enamine deaminase RidA (YjgF/YER057c/UK114 family)